ncbi:MAG: hypothetical protein R6U46_07410 [Marinilabilia sp.]
MKLVYTKRALFSLEEALNDYSLKLQKNKVMDIETRKLNVINRISHLQDETVLSRIEQLQSHKQDWWDLISEEEKAEIKEGISQADKGETRPHSEVMKKYQKWL